LAGKYLIRDSWDFVRNARIVRAAMEYSAVIPDYVASLSRPAEVDVSFDAVHTYVMFLGVGRSGTTLLGALLDAHPNVIIANEQNTLKYLYPIAFSRERIFHLLLRNALQQATRGRPGGGGYRYAVPGQFQGRSETIEVIGDKSRSAQAVEWLSFRPDLLRRLSETTRCDIALLHVVRNPFDTIARRSLRRGVSLEKITREYLVLTARLDTLLQQIDATPQAGVKRVPLHLEALISQPAEVLGKLCRDLGVQPISTYIEACSRLVYEKPVRARKLVSWPPRLVRQIEEQIESVSWLGAYSLQGD
jgi:hypothetical protein